jgi:hypothetical protein
MLHDHRTQRLFFMAKTEILLTSGIGDFHPLGFA